MRPLRLLRLALGFSRLLIAEGDAAPARVLLDEVEAGLRDKPVDDPYAGPERITLIARRAELARVGGDLPAARTLLAAALVQPLPAPGGDLSSALALLEVLARTAPDAATARAALDTFGSLGDESAYARRDVENQARLDQVLGRLLLYAGDTPGV